MFVAALPAAVAQGSPDTVSDPTLDAPSAPAEPFLDRKVGSALERFSAWKARMKKEHFTEYLAGYTGLLAAVTGLVFGLVAYRMSDPMSPYRLIRRRTLQLAAAIGGSLGIFAAVTQVPPNATGKVSLLVLATGVGAATAFLGAWIAFLIMRLLANGKARRDGRRVTDRMRHA
jgi:hypothetical protein